MTYRSRNPLFPESRLVNIHVVCFTSKIFYVLQNTASSSSYEHALHGACKWMRAIRALMHRWANAALAWVDECIHPWSSRVSRVSRYSLLSSPSSYVYDTFSLSVQIYSDYDIAWLCYTTTKILCSKSLYIPQEAFNTHDIHATSLSCKHKYLNKM